MSAGDLTRLGINAATRGLFAAQAALTTAGHDITNANTEGFSRQRVEQSSLHQQFPLGTNSDRVFSSIGNGVEVTRVTRLREGFLDDRFRAINLSYSEQAAVNNAIREIEGVFNEPSDSGLNATLASFFDSWHELSTHPTESSARAAVREAGKTLARALNETAAGLSAVRRHLDSQVAAATDEINAHVREIAALNAQIVASQGSGLSPNDLLDARDLALDRLSGLVKTNLSTHSDGSIWVYCYGKGLVTGIQANELKTLPGTDMGLSNIAYKGELLTPEVLGGRLKGLLEVRDQVIGRSLVPDGFNLPNTPNGLAYQLDQVASQLAEAVNALHAAGTNLAGTPSIEFFAVDAARVTEGASLSRTTITAHSIAVNDLLVEAGLPGLDLISAGGAPTTDPVTGLPVTPKPADNRTALAIAQLRDRPLIRASFPYAGGSQEFSVQDYYRNILTTLGVSGQAADRQEANQKALRENVESQRQAVSGVNLDEEFASMIKHQHAYAASARLITVFDDMMKTVVELVR
ncbi:MAG: flagellar hook-associated protein FlgK [Candidatus Sericytochromatia bacterium]|nr:flagellar hook-associated protein FlgK [Candidatus Sericytochromatia bacterium]